MSCVQAPPGGVQIRLATTRALQRPPSIVRYEDRFTTPCVAKTRDARKKNPFQYV